MLRRFLITLVLLAPSLAFGQGTVLQGGPQASGRVPMYIGTGSQAVIGDSGSAAGGGVGVGLGELNITSRSANGDNTAPYASNGNGQLGAHFCMYDAPITNSTGYHYFCLDPNAQGGGLIAYGAGGSATQSPLAMYINGSRYEFPFVSTGVVGPTTTVSGDTVCWNNTQGTLVKDCGYTNINVTGSPYFADRTGAVDATSVIQAAITAAGQSTTTNGGTVFFPCGTYLISSTLSITLDHTALVGESTGCVYLMRQTDFGAAISGRCAASSGCLLFETTIRNITVFDKAALTGACTGSGCYTIGWSTCAQSPYQYVFDGAVNVRLENISIAYGCGALALLGVYNAWVTNANFIVAQIPFVPGQNGVGTLVYIGTSSNNNLATKYSSNIWFDQLEVEGGARFTEQKAAVGVHVSGIDGVWLTSPHVQSVQTADFRFSQTSTGSASFDKMANIFVTNALADTTLGNGILMDGSVQIQRFKFEGAVSAFGAGGADKHGVYVTGTGGLLAAEFNIDVDGWGGAGMYVDSTTANTGWITIRPKTFWQNSLTTQNTYNDIDLRTGSDYSIIGGVLQGTSSNTTWTKSGIALADPVARVAVSGIVITGHRGYPMTIAASTTKVAVGNSVFYGNLANNDINNLAGADQVSITGVMGATSLVPTAINGVDQANAFRVTGTAITTRFGFDASIGYVQAVANDLLTFKPLSLDGSTVTMRGNGGTTSAIIDSVKFSTTVPMQMPRYTVATLPSGVIGMRAFITDQVTGCPANGAAIGTGGAFVCPVYYNGAAWVGG